MIKDENYFVVHGWMRNRLNLKGLDLDVYAVLYGFSQDGESEFKGTVKYIMDFTGGGRTAVKNSLNRLAKNQFIRKVERNQKTGEPNGYICTPLEELYVILQGGRNTTTPPDGKRLGGGLKTTTPWAKNDHNKEIYKEDYKEIVSKKESKNLKNKKDLQSYEEIFEDFGVGKILKEAYFRFIAHLKVNHNVVMLNERLQTLIVRMDFSYKEDCDKIRALDEAIAKNYKRLECESA